MKENTSLSKKKKKSLIGKEIISDQVGHRGLDINK